MPRLGVRKISCSSIVSGADKTPRTFSASVVSCAGSLVSSTISVNSSPAQACDGVDFAQVLAQPCGHLLQHAIADGGPSVSLISLKRSRSGESTPRSVLIALARRSRATTDRGTPRGSANR